MLACACIFVAAKVLEQPRKIRDVLNTAQSVRRSMQRSTARGAKNGVAESGSSSSSSSLSAAAAAAAAATATAAAAAAESLPDQTATLQAPTPDGVVLPAALNKEYWALKSRLVAMEQHLLRALGFDLQPDRPHLLLANYLRSLKPVDHCGTSLCDAVVMLT